MTGAALTIPRGPGVAMSPAYVKRFVERVPKRAEKDDILTFTVMWEGLSGPQCIATYVASQAEHVENFVKELLEEVQYDCEVRQMECRYQIQALVNGEVAKTHPLVTRPANSNAVEGASAEGLLAQGMRHLEIREQTHQVAFRSMMGGMSQQLEFANNRIQTLEEDRSTMMELVTKLLAENAELQRESKEVNTDKEAALVREKRMGAMEEYLMAELGPLVMKRFKTMVEEGGDDDD